MECCFLLSLNSDLNLIDIKKLLNEDYSIIPEKLEANSEITLENKQYKNFWKYDELVQDISLKDNVTYFTAMAHMEILSGSYYDKNGVIKKNKIDRMVEIKVPVVFLEIDISGIKSCFALVSTCKTTCDNIKTRLFCEGRKANKTLREKWKLSKDSNGILNLTSEFFLWILINCRNKKIADIDILDINHILDQDESNNRHHSTEGKDALNDTLANAALSFDPKLLKIGMTLENSLGYFQFKTTNMGTLDISPKTYLKKNQGEKLELDPNENISEIMANIYGDIFPKLLEQYNTDRSTLVWRSEIATAFIEQQGKKAILDLAVKFNLLDKEERKLISTEDIEKIIVVKKGETF